jgi:Ser/Thr protein kinase RdoA (MazF antagonist)
VGAVGSVRPVAEVEVPLAGGDVTEGLVRVGDTVRRPRQPWSEPVAAFLGHLVAAGFPAPRWLGVDDAGRDVLDFLPGDVPGSPPQAWACTDEVLAAVGRFLRRLHTAAAGFAPPAGARWFGTDRVVELPADVPPLFTGPPELVSHCDMTPQNVVFAGAEPIGLIDFDLTRPTTHLADVVGTAIHWLPLGDPTDRAPVYAAMDIPSRLKIFVDAYGLDPARRAEFLAQARRGAVRSWHLMKANAEQRGGGWARMWDAGVGDAIRRRQDWLLAEAPALEAALA